MQTALLSATDAAIRRALPPWVQRSATTIKPSPKDAAAPKKWSVYFLCDDESCQFNTKKCQVSKRVTATSTTRDKENAEAIAAAIEKKHATCCHAAMADGGTEKEDSSLEANRRCDQLATEVPLAPAFDALIDTR